MVLIIFLRRRNISWQSRRAALPAAVCSSSLLFGAYYTAAFKMLCFSHSPRHISSLPKMQALMALGMCHRNHFPVSEASHICLLYHHVYIWLYVGKCDILRLLILIHVQIKAPQVSYFSSVVISIFALNITSLITGVF